MDGTTDALSAPETLRRFNDPIHDYIPFSALVCTFIDTGHFQRLRYIKQLGVSYYVWPGASHNRFEHCLGVAYLARTLAEHLRKTQPSLGITDRELLCVELAGLCHDLGHGPWSHVWDGMFIPKATNSKKKWRHEDASEMMFDDMVIKYRLDITPDEVNLVKALIAGDVTRCRLGKLKPFLFEIVANKRNGIDVDKFDYIARDAHAIGDKNNLSLTRLIHSARVIDNEICFDIKDANQIYELCYTRFSLHKRIYNHKTAKAIEYMIIDALLAAEHHMKIIDLIDKPDKYLFLTDDVLTRIEMSTEDTLKDARDIIERIRVRDLYKVVDFKVYPWDYKERCRKHITPERIVEMARKLALSTDTTFTEELSPSHVIVNLSPLHYGMEDRNPLDFVRFYSKHSPMVAHPGSRDTVSSLMPESFGEVLLRIFTKEPRFFSIIQRAYREILQTVFNDSEDMWLPEVSGVLTPTPEPPSTPRQDKRTFSRVTSLGSLSEKDLARPNPFTDAQNSPLLLNIDSRKRARAEITHEGSPPRKRKAM